MTARVLLPLLVALVLAAPAAAAPTLTSITPDGTFDLPVHVAAPPEDPHRLFVVEKSGIVKVVVDGGAPQVFLDLTAEVDEDGEEGLLSIGFARDYATSRRFYLYFTAEDPAQGDGSMIRIVEFTRPEATPNTGEGSTRRQLLEVPHPTATNHNGGQLQVAADGAVWLATGDGAVAPTDAQDPGSLLGKLIRIDPAAPDPPQVMASGLRNPWRFSFDRANGDLLLGDVGAGTREEIDFAPSGSAGTNFGWPCFEGTVNGPVSCSVPVHTPPIYDYDSTSFGCGVVGGYMVRDAELPTLAGRYLYGDLCREKLRSLALSSPATTDREEELPLASLVGFGEDQCGHVYAVSIAGTVARLHDGPVTTCPDPPAGGGPGGGTGPGGGGSVPGGGTGPGGGSGADTTGPGLSVDRARRQRLLANKAVFVGVRCSEACRLSTEANARLSVRGTTRKWAFKALSASLAAGERPRLRLKLSKAMRAALAKRVARGAQPLVKIVVIARDTAGNETRRTVYVRVVG